MSTTTIALQPFENLAGDPAQDVLARGLAYSLATELARFVTLEVIPPGSAAHVLAATDPDDAGTRLYVLRGGLRRIDGRIRLSVQLTERASGRQVWADRIDAGAEILTSRTTSSRRWPQHWRRAPTKHGSRRRVASRWSASKPTSAGCVDESASSRAPWNRTSGRACFERALELDPHFARAYTGLAFQFNEWSCQAWVQWDETERHAYEFARRATDLDSSDAMVEIVPGRITLYRRR